jgi:prepilin peptidase dependent protein B
MLRIRAVQKRAGFTLVELLTALVLNLVLFGALFTIFLSNVQHYWTSISLNQLNQQMQTAMMIMSSEIRRAGYWANAQSDLGSTTNNNPFMAAGTDITIGNSNTCILFTYDSDSNGSLPSVGSASDDERYGFRLDNQALQARPYGASFNCAAASSAVE